MTVYVDVLIVVNIYVNYFLIKSANMFLHRRTKIKRILLAAFAGSLFSLSVFLPENGLIFTLLLKVLSSFVITLIAFGRKKLFINTGILFLISSSFAGLMLAVCTIFSPDNITSVNGNVYFNVSFISIAVLTVIAYLFIKLIRYIIDSKNITSKKVDLSISIGGKSKTLPCFMDSGNMLTDVYTGKPVIICEYESLSEILPSNVSEYLFLGKSNALKLIPYKTVNSNGLIPVVRADIKAMYEDDMSKQIDALIGICTDNNSEGAIINPKLLV